MSGAWKNFCSIKNLNEHEEH